MPVVNRFTQPLQPLVFNPISAETFAMIPLAKAESIASGIKAASSYNIDFDVDIKDQKVIADMSKNVDDGKNSIIDRIMSEGVTDNLLTEFSNLKKVYSTTRDKVRLAEANKDKITKWKDQVLRIHQNSPDYANYVYNKEYTESWGGTFNEDGTTAQFDASIGPKYFSFAEDAKKALSGIDMTLVKDIGSGGRFVMEKDPAGIPRMAYVSSTGKKEYNNIDKVNSRMNAFLAMYNDPNTERGKYREYRKVDIKDVGDIFTSVAESMYREDTRGGDTRKQFLKMPEITSPPLPPPSPEYSAPLRTTVPQDAGLVTQGSDLDYNPAVRSALYMIPSLLKATLAGIVSAFPGGNLYAEASSMNDDIFAGIGEEYDVAKQIYNVDTEKVDEIKSASSESIINKILSEKRGEEYISSQIGSYNLNIQNNGDEDKLWKEAVKVQNRINAGNDSQSEYMEFYDEYVIPYTKDNVENTIAKISYLTSESLANKKLGLKNDKKGVIEDLASELLTGQGINRPIMNLDTRYANTEDVIEKVTGSLMNRGRAVSTLNEGEYHIEFVGNGGSHPDMYKNNNSEYVEDLAFGGIFNITKKTADGMVKAGTFIIGPSQSVLLNPNYSRLQNEIRAIGNIPLEGEIEVAYNTNEKSYKGTMGRSIISQNSIDRRTNSPITTSPGALSLYLPSEGSRLQYSQDMNGSIDIIYSSYDLEQQRNAKNKKEEQKTNQYKSAWEKRLSNIRN